MSSKAPQWDIMVIRHSLSHVLAASVRIVCPNAKLGIGPPIDEGFYYDFLLPAGFTFSTEILEQITEKMAAMIKENLDFIQKEIGIEEAKKIFASEPFKIQLIEELAAKGNKTVGTYQMGGFTDLCAGPHVDNTRSLYKAAWKLDRVSGAYWKGSEKNPMMQRIYALAFSNKTDLNDFIKQREEAAKRDHRKLGPELELFTFSDLIGKGLPILLPKGATLRRILERFTVDEELRRGYQHVYTAPMGKKDLYVISGHWAHYQDSMYPPMVLGENEEIVLRPMTCPHHFMAYKDTPKSYRDLPVRLAEISPQFRREQSGELTGLLRVMMFHLADAHIFCTLEQLESEFESVVELIRYMMQRLGVESNISYRASLRDDNKEKYVDNPAMWELGEKILMGILDKLKIQYVKGVGHAAFYGPKLDIQMRNAYGKEETAFTVQIDFVMPERFDLTYIDNNGEKKRPVVVHRSSIGCFERTIAFLVEFYGGAFPLWLAPVQAKILPVSEAHTDYTKEVMTVLQQKLIRVEADLRNETISKKIREARLMRIPYLLIVGEKEASAHTVTVRNRDTGEQNTIPLDTFVERILAEQQSFALKLNADSK